MAKQKKIPELFSGETTVREKAFQRIFMVPNTERLRSIIWDNYMKTCPPPLPEDELAAIDVQLVELAKVLGPKDEKLTLLSSSVLSEQQMLAVVSYTDYYNKCLQDSQKRPGLLQQEAEYVAQIEEWLKQETFVADKIKTSPPDLENQFEKLLVKKEQYRNYMQQRARLTVALHELENLQVDGPALAVEIQGMQENCSTVSVAAGIKALEVTRLEEELKELQSLTTAATCPTCKQPLKDIGQHVLEVTQKLNTAKEERAQADKLQLTVCSQLPVKKGLYVKWEGLNLTVSSLTSQLSLSEVQFDEAELTAVQTQRNTLNENVTLLNSVQNKRVQAQAKLSILQDQIKNLVSYDGSATPSEELVLMQEVLQRHRARIQEIGLLEKEVARHRMEIQLLQQRKEASQVNHQKNLQRSEYLNKLRSAYDVLHTSQFPRKLVQTYSSVVEEELQQQLQRFDLPYQASINEEFQIVITKGGYTIPRLSGGQEMVVGLCLRLALHSMFSQAFPMLIVDEGTTHLDEENKALYFQCINDLKTDKAIQQLIIIDHCSLLVGAVDNVIRL